MKGRVKGVREDQGRKYGGRMGMGERKTARTVKARENAIGGEVEK